MQQKHSRQCDPKYRLKSSSQYILIIHHRVIQQTTVSFWVAETRLHLPQVNKFPPKWVKYLVIPSSIFSLPHPQESSPLSANHRQGLLNRANIPRTCWVKLFGPQMYLCRSLTNTLNYICKAKVYPIKNQLHLLNTPNYVHEQMFAQLRMGLTEANCGPDFNHLPMLPLHWNCSTSWMTFSLPQMIEGSLLTVLDLSAAFNTRPWHLPSLAWKCFQPRNLSCSSFNPFIWILYGHR